MPAAISASRVPAPLAISAGAVGITDRARRRMAGTLVRAGEVGLTDAGPLRVPDPSLLEWPEDLSTVDLTREHELDVVRGHMVSVDVTPERIYVVAGADEGPLGDAALAEAADRGPNGRAAFSYRVERPVLRPGADGIPDLIGGLVTTVGQVHDPAYNSARIDHVAASKTPGNEPGSTKENDMKLTPEQVARLAELRAKQNLTDEERAELDALVSLEQGEAAEAAAEENPPAEPAAPAAPAVAASAAVPAVPGGVPRPAARTQKRGGALQHLVEEITRGLQTQLNGGSALPAISAAFSDVTSTAHTSKVEEVAWSGELWSGLEYEPVFSDLLTPDKLTNWEGKGWRFVLTPEMQDYSGDKAAVPSGNVSTEQAGYTAARMAVGVDIDRKFYDFPNEAFVRGLLERVRETWEIKLDDKSRLYITSAAQKAGRPVNVTLTSGSAVVTAPAGTFIAGDATLAIVGAGIPEGATITTFTSSSQVTISANATATGSTLATVAYAAAPTILKAAARVAQALKNTRVGRASWIMLNDEDMFKLLDLTEQNLPVLLELWGIDPKNFRSSPYVAAGTVLGGVRQAAKLRTLPGSPIRVSAQHLANGGVDEAFFGYWATEEHHPRGILSMAHTQA